MTVSKWVAIAYFVVTAMLGAHMVLTSSAVA